MSTPAPVEWGDVIDRFMEAVKQVLYGIGDFIVTNASAIAQAVVGLGLAYGIWRLATRALPIVRGIFGRFF